MQDFFEEKAHQIIPDTLVAFGIEIQSRYGKSFEILEMITFCQAIAYAGIAHYVKKIFYDSKSTIPFIEIIDGVVTEDPIELKLRSFGFSHFSQFNLLDVHYTPDEDDIEKSKRLLDSYNE